ncbi:MAG: ABC-F family ATP-binding cassette domain-containing protein [Marinilabiliaceae bacterium]|jgi:ATP-binding cassette subfamily F protein 3|nr:ABC-F family ATP-binding cassette domain-containing protein [Marinilabiliaceae bacterium]
MISVDSLSVYFGNFALLDKVSFLVNQRDRIGLTGKNGAGKTTLLRILAGELNPSEGSIGIPSGTSIGYLPQQMEVSDQTTVKNEALRAYSELFSLEDKIEAITAEIGSRSDYESDDYLKRCDQLADLQEEYRIKGGDNIEAEIELTLLGLGFAKDDFSKPTSQLSGGWRMRIELAKIILKKPSVLLLDEPTNHLDIESIEWLEGFLRNYPGEVIMVSHDRAFLDNITTRTIEISLSRIYDYRVPYSKYLEQREERREQQLAAYRNQQKMINDTERFIERFRYKNTKSVQVQSRIKHLDKLDRIEVDEEDKSRINIRFSPAPRSGTIVVEAENLGKKYGDLTVLNEIDLIIERGQKVAFVGKNGEGKTTLSRIIMNEIDYSGSLKLGHNLKIGYFAQNQDELLNNDLTVLQTIDNVAVGEIRTRIRDILGAFLFGGEDVDKKVRVLSGGEKSRLALIKLLLEPYNLLVLDEPTNHLDLLSKDILKAALQKYDGTLIVVSHDRDFMDGLVEKVYEFRNQKVKEHIGSIYEFLRKKKLDTLKQLERRTVDEARTEKKEDSDTKKSYLEKKDTDRRIRKIEKELAQNENEIESLEAEKEELEKALADPETVKDSGSMFARYEEIGKIMEKKLAEWEKLNLTLEQLNKK